jgi:cytochrome c-type biogenesis protein
VGQAILLPGIVIHLSYPLAFLAGLASFLSPCVFPLVPAYAAYLGGRATAAGAGTLAAPRSPRLLVNGLAFCLGFSAVFVGVFYVLQALDVPWVAEHRRLVDVVAGAVIVVLALQTLGLLRLGLLAQERRFHLVPRSAGVLPSTLLGVAFAAGWTPCVGTQLGFVLTLAQQGDFTGLPVMLVYCAGLAVPFLVVAVLADRAAGLLRAVNRRLGLVNLVAGSILLVFGVLLMAGQLTVLNQYSARSPFDL